MARPRKSSYKKYKDEKTPPGKKSKGSDRLSSLPDQLIASILSHLPAKEVFQTCMLAKGWCDVWALVPSLSFDLRDFNDDFKRFKDFVRNFLLERDGTMDTQSFRFLCEGLETIDCLDWATFDRIELIGYLVKHNIKNFELSYEGYLRLDIADCLFTCQTLENLKLSVKRWHLEQLKPSTVYLPRLRKLDLTQICFHDGELEKILSGCPVLEELRLDECALEMSSFSCHRVKRLQLLNPIAHERTITIYVPFVENLVLSSDTDCRFLLKNTSKLTHAFWLDVSGVEEEEYACHLLNSLCGVKDLEISSSSVKVYHFSSFKS
jgi:F-box domain